MNSFFHVQPYHKCVCVRQAMDRNLLTPRRRAAADEEELASWWQDREPDPLSCESAEKRPRVESPEQQHPQQQLQPVQLPEVASDGDDVLPLAEKSSSDDSDDESSGSTSGSGSGVPEGWVANLQDRQSQRQYLGTWARSTMAKATFGDLLWKLGKACFRGSNNFIRKASVFEELHQDGSSHLHFPVLADKPWSWLSLWRRLRKQGISVHWSSAHSYYWGALIYVAVPSESKPKDKLDSQPWLSPDHPTMEESLRDIPRGARRCDKDRVRAFLGIAATGATAVMTDVEFAKYITDNDWRTRLQVLANIETAVKRNQDDDKARAAQEFIFRRRNDLNDIIAFAYEVKAAPKTLVSMSTTAWEAVESAHRNGVCTCEGRWIPLTEELLRLQQSAFPEESPAGEKPQGDTVRAAFVNALKTGAQKHVNVFIYGDRSTGKSHLLDPLVKIFGTGDDGVFLRPGGRGNFPLQGLLGKRACVLQDIRSESFGLEWDTLLVWLEGQPFSVPLPRNKCSSDAIYTAAAPIFATAGEKLRISVAECNRTGLDARQQNEMMNVRWRCFHFCHKFNERTVVRVPPCPRCFATWLVAAVSSAPAPAAPAAAHPPLAAAARQPAEEHDPFGHGGVFF